MTGRTSETVIPMETRQQSDMELEDPVEGEVNPVKHKHQAATIMEDAGDSHVEPERAFGSLSSPSRGLLARCHHQRPRYMP